MLVRTTVTRCSNDLLGDPGYQMLRQATQGPVDFITGDYLAEVNLAENGINNVSRKLQTSKCLHMRS